MTAARRRGSEGGAPSPPGAEGVAHEVFRDVYRRSKALWVTGRPQPAVLDAIERGWFDEGPLFDAGCGTGENAIAIAKARPTLEILAVDSVPEAVESAVAGAHAAGVADRIRFEVADLRMMEAPSDRRCVLDAGLMHVFSDADRRDYLGMLHDSVGSGGSLVLIAFSDREDRPGGPRRLARKELATAIDSAGFDVESIEASRYETLGHEGGARSWLLRAFGR